MALYLFGGDYLDPFISQAHEMCVSYLHNVLTSYRISYNIVIFQV